MTNYVSNKMKKKDNLNGPVFNVHLIQVLYPEFLAVRQLFTVKQSEFLAVIQVL